MKSNKRIALTGATGFLGSALLDELDANNVVVFGRSKPNGFNGSYVKFDATTLVDHVASLQGIDVLIHCAARAHIMNDHETDPLEAYRAVNTKSALALARQAAASGVKRFIFISSIKVNGESTTGRRPYLAEDASKPSDSYGLSKAEAEAGLQEISEETGMEVVIIRPPLIYGPGVKANFYNLLKISHTKLPLPFACVNNKRSMVYLGNLVEFIIRCIDHPHAANQTFLVSDGEDLSLRSLVAYIRQSMGRNPLLLPVPLMFFKLAGKLAGKEEVVDRLIGDLQVDSSKVSELLDWTPPYNVEQGIQITVDDFLKRKN